MKTDFAAAERYLREALELRRARLGPEHTVTAKTMFDLASALVWLGRLDEAEQLVRQGLDAYEKLAERFGPDHFYTRLTATDLVSLYERKNDLASANRYRSTAPR